MDLDRRPYDLFLSHAHADAGFARTLHDWLVRIAGLTVWFDADSMAAGSLINRALERGINNSRAAVVLATAEAVKKGWVQKEIAHAEDEAARSNGRFKVIAVVIGDVDDDLVGRGASKIMVPEQALTRPLAAGLLRALYPVRPPPGSGRRDVYLSCSWRTADRERTRALVRVAAAEGLRLIGDSKDRQSYGADRIADIMQTCGGFVALLPDRGAGVAEDAPDNPYRYFMREIATAVRLSLPTVVVAPEGVAAAEGADAGWCRYDPGEADLPDAAAARISALYEQSREPEQRDLVFLATDLEHEERDHIREAKALIESITGMACVTGQDMRGPVIQQDIMTCLSGAQLVIADLTGPGKTEPNVNVAIEAGVARAFGRDLAMMAWGRQRRPPFMLQHAGQLETYETDVERLGLIHRFAKSYRRRIFNDELIGW